MAAPLAPLQTSPTLEPRGIALVRSRVSRRDEDRARSPEIAAITELIATNMLETVCGDRVK